MNFCAKCGGPVVLKTPPGDDRPRYVCSRCGTVHYQNPRVVVGCIPRWDGKILLCRRAIAPRYGRWTLPAGYLENGESLEQGTRRELWEEAGATAQEMVPYGMYNLIRVNQVYLMFRTRLADDTLDPGEESLEVDLFPEDRIPWGELAFPVIERTLERYCRDRASGAFPVHMEDIVVRMKEED
jgi:ADP-ribose pyrophosphatase YjhB (NUDIX family)